MRFKLFALLGAALLLGGWLLFSGEPPTRLTFLAVGQGDCAVFQTGGHTVLIDVGPSARGFDAGERIVSPDLRKMGIGAVDLILLSHPDADHTGGLGAVLRAFPVGKIGISAAFSRHEGLLAQLRAANCMDRVLWLGPDQRVSIDDFTLEVGCPTLAAGAADNDGSEFVKITGRGASAVLTGDAGTETEAQMLPKGDWSAQVLKLGHHGSHTSSSEAFLDEVQPRWAVISCGRANKYGHPHQDVLDRLARRRISTARTDREGDIVFEVGSRGFERVR